MWCEHASLTAKVRLSVFVLTLFGVFLSIVWLDTRFNVLLICFIYIACFDIIK